MTRQLGYYNSKNEKRGLSFLNFFKGTRQKKFKRRDFWKKNFKNPYFIKDRMPKRTKAPRLKMSLGIISVFGALLIFLIHPFFKINKIEISDLKNANKEDINKITEEILNSKRWFLFNGRNIFLVDTKKIKNNLDERFSFQELKIAKNFPQTLIIAIKEKEPRIIFKKDAQLWLLDGEAKKIQETTDMNLIKSLNLPVIGLEKTEFLEKNFETGTGLISKSNIEFISFLFKNLTKQSKISADEFILNDRDSKIMNVITNEGWKIIFDRQNDWETQLQVLNIILKDKIKEKRKLLNYIDVRFENRSYFQYKN